MYTFGLATLIAEAFIPHPRHHTHIIFKDRNHHHCTKDNIAWVDAETYFYYCCPGKRGRPRLIIDRQEAITTCTSEELKRYYLTLDPYWIGEAWKNVEARMSPYSFWHDLRSDCYLYYIDRVKRFSILSDPNKVIWFYVKRALIQLKKEISPDLLYRKLRETDESLRKIIFKD